MAIMAGYNGQRAMLKKIKRKIIKKESDIRGINPLLILFLNRKRKNESIKTITTANSMKSILTHPHSFI